MERQLRRPGNAWGAACGTPPPGSSCQNIACSGQRTCNLARQGGEATGCCCDALCSLFGDCCEDKADCCGSELSEPRRGQRLIPRAETAAYAAERVTPSGVNVPRGINVRTGAGLLLSNDAQLTQAVWRTQLDASAAKRSAPAASSDTSRAAAAAPAPFADAREQD
jgi:hypothetical protein